MSTIKLHSDNPLDRIVSIQLKVKHLLILDAIVGKDFSKIKSLSEVLLVDDNLLQDFKDLSICIHMESSFYKDF